MDFTGRVALISASREVNVSEQHQTLPVGRGNMAKIPKQFAMRYVEPLQAPHSQMILL